MTINLEPIGIVHNERKVIEDDNWGNIISTIKLDQKILDSSALDGLNQFSHVEVIFYMDQVKPEKIIYDARFPRNNPEFGKYGILAQRGKNRPNQIGVSFAEVILANDLTLQVKGLDAIDKTPVLDIKPCFKEFLPRKEIHQPLWSTDLMKNYY